MNTGDQLDDLAHESFERWADSKHYSLFSRAPLRKVWLSAFAAGVDAVRLPDDDDQIELPDSAA